MIWCPSTKLRILYNILMKKKKEFEDVKNAIRNENPSADWQSKMVMRFFLFFWNYVKINQETIDR